MFSPTDVVVTVRQARNLIIKAKGGVNNAYATIEFMKEKYVTGTEKSLTPKWFTECTFSLPHGGVFTSKVVIIICLYHKRHGKLGLEPDDFIGQVIIPLSALNSNDSQARTRWYNLTGKKKDSKKERGEVEIAMRFLHSQKEAIVHEPKSSPPSIRMLSSSIRNKLRRRSDDEDSGLGVSEGDRTQSFGLGRGGRSFENLSTPSILDTDVKAFERSYRTSSTNSSPGDIVSARGSARFLQTGNNLSPSKAMSIEVLHRPETKPPLSPLVRVDSGVGSDDGTAAGGGGNRRVKKFIKQHVRNRSLPDVKQVTKSGLRKDDTTKSALCINGSHLYVPGSRDSGSSSLTGSPELKHRCSSMEDVSAVPVIKSRTQTPVNKNTSNSTRRHSMINLESVKDKESLKTVYKPKSYYRLDVRDLLKVSTIHENPTSAYESMSRDDLLKLVTSQHQQLEQKDAIIRELEDYIDSLLVKVMTFKPTLLDGSLKVRNTSTDSKLTHF